MLVAITVVNALGSLNPSAPPPITHHYHHHHHPMTPLTPRPCVCLQNALVHRVFLHTLPVPDPHDPGCLWQEPLHYAKQLDTLVLLQRIMVMMMMMMMMIMMMMMLFSIGS
jgi:hypothetical protein